MTDYDLSGDVILVTGASGGIGQETVKKLREHGATVIGTDLKAAGDILAHDVSSEADWARIADHVRQKHGKLSALVNNAGLAITESIEGTTLATWRKVQSINVESLLLSLHAFMPLLRAGSEGRKGGASVVNISSVGGLRGAAFNAAYCSSKSAVAMFSKCAAVEYGMLGYNIRVNSVHPGGIDTAMMHGIFQRYVDLGATPDAAAALSATSSRHPIGRLGKPEEIANGIVYLCAPASSFATGSELVIDGAFTSI